MPDRAAGTTRGAVAIADRPRRKSPLRWLFWLALILLLALVALVALVALNGNDEGDDPGIDLQDDTGQPSGG